MALQIISLAIISFTLPSLERGLYTYVIPAIIAVVSLTFYGLYIIVSRKKDKKFSIYYSEGKKIYEKIIYNNLKEHNIPFTINKANVTINNTGSKLEFTSSGFIFTNYKTLPDYEGFFEDLEKNIKSSPYKSDKRSQFISIAFMVVFTVLFWAFSIYAYVHKL